MRVEVANRTRTAPFSPQTRNTAVTATQKFGLLLGDQAVPPTVTLLDANGAFIADQQGRPLLLNIQVGETLR